MCEATEAGQSPEHWENCWGSVPMRGWGACEGRLGGKGKREPEANCEGFKEFISGVILTNDLQHKTGRFKFVI